MKSSTGHLTLYVHDPEGGITGHFRLASPAEIADQVLLRKDLLRYIEAAEIAAAASPAPPPSDPIIEATEDHPAIYRDGHRLTATPPRASPVPPDLAALREEVRQLRYGIWLGHGHTGTYGDDGEMQCVECQHIGAIDYKRASPHDVTEIVRHLARQVAAAARPSEDTADKRDAERWRALVPFLRADEDGDSDATWIDLSLQDADTGDDRIEISPCDGIIDVGGFVDELIRNPASRVGHKPTARPAASPQEEKP